VVAIIGLLASVALPSLNRARNKAAQTACIQNLRLIDAAKQHWALENKRADTDTPGPEDIKVYLRNQLFPTCPAGGAYTIGALNADPACSRSADPHFPHALPAP